MYLYIYTYIHTYISNQANKSTQTISTKNIEKPHHEPLAQFSTHLFGQLRS